MNIGSKFGIATPGSWAILQSRNPGIALLKSGDSRDCSVPNYSIKIYNYNLLHELKFHTNWRFRLPRATVCGACDRRVWHVAGISVSWRCIFEAPNLSKLQNSGQLVHVVHQISASTRKHNVDVQGGLLRWSASIYLLMASVCCTRTKLHSCTCTACWLSLLRRL
jgi:hypothetical protein